MSFVGAVASSVRQVLANYAAEVSGPVLICGAGNFTVPSVLRSGGFSGPMAACDVSLYTSALGAYLGGWTLDVAEKKTCPDAFKGLLRTGSSLETAASIALLLDLREVWQMKNLFQERAVRRIVSRWDELHSETCSRLEMLREHVGPIEYAAQDGFDFLPAHGPGNTVFAFPPTYRRGYERLEQLFGEIVEWTPPEYREMTDKSIELYEMIARFDSYFVVLEKDLPEVYEVLGQPVARLPRGRGSYTYIVARGARPIVVRKKATSREAGAVWPPDRPITGREEVSVRPLSLQQTIRLNELFLSSRIEYFTGGVGLSVAFLLDGLIVGKADFAPSSHQWALGDERPMIYVMSDLAVPSACEKRLAKLVLMLMLSREVRQAVDGRWMQRFGWAITTAFSRHPVSMKYRGLFKLHKRTEVEGGFSLNYYAEFGLDDLRESLLKWRKKFK